MRGGAAAVPTPPAAWTPIRRDGQHSPLFANCQDPPARSPSTVPRLDTRDNICTFSKFVHYLFCTSVFMCLPHSGFTAEIATRQQAGPALAIRS